MTTTRAPEHWVRLDGEDRDGSIEAFELFSARRALGLVKGKLGRVGVLELLHEEIEAGSAFLRERVHRAQGRELTGTTMLRAHGISAAEFGGWLARAFGRQDVLLAAHPEHYSIHQEPGRDVNIVETLGEHVCSFFMRPWSEADVAQQGPSAPGAAAGGSGAGTRRSHMVLADGTVVGSIATGFADAEGGFTAHLSVTLPEGCGPLVEQHLEHFAVEFRNWILRAAEELSAPGTVMP